MDKTPEPSHHSSPRPFAVYYGWPSALGNRDRLLAEFEVVILGAGLERPDHPDHAAARKLVTELKAHAVNVYGYLDLAAIATELTPRGIESGADTYSKKEPPRPVQGGTAAAASVQPVERTPEPIAPGNIAADAGTQHIERALKPLGDMLAETMEKLAAMDLAGFLLDRCGGEHGVGLSARKLAIDTAHQASLAVVLNAGDPSEALFGLPLRAGDGYLIEGFMLADGRDASGLIAAAKYREAQAVRERTGISIFGIATLEPGSGEDSSGIGNAGVVELWQAAEREQLDYFLITDPLYGARGPHKDMVAALLAKSVSQ